MHTFGEEMVNSFNIIIIIEIVIDRSFAEADLGIQAGNEKVMTQQSHSQ